MFLNSKATLLDITCIKIFVRLPWVKIYQRLRNRKTCGDKYAVKVLKQNELVGHVPRDISKYCTSALLWRGTIKCEMTWKRQNKRGNGIEFPCNPIRASAYRYVERRWYVVWSSLPDWLWSEVVATTLLVSRWMDEWIELTFCMLINGVRKAKSYFGYAQ